MAPPDNTMPSPQPGGQPQQPPGGAAGQGQDALSLVQSLAASGMFGGAKSSKPSNVFMGQYGPLPPSVVQSMNISSYLKPMNYRQTPITEDIQQTIDRYYQWSDQQKQDLRNQLSLIDKSALTASDADIAKIWGDYAQQAANYFSAGQAITPWDIIAKDVSSRAGQSSKAGTKTETTSDTSLTSRLDSDAIFRSAAQSLLGRNPTDAENAKFQQLLNDQERANPTTATITTTTDDEGRVIATNRQSEGGVTGAGAAELARRQALQNPESGAYQAATVYFNAFKQALAS